MAHLALRARVTHVLGMGPDQIRSEGMGMARGSGWGAAQVVQGPQQAQLRVSPRALRAPEKPSWRPLTAGLLMTVSLFGSLFRTLNIVIDSSSLCDLRNVSLATLFLPIIYMSFEILGLLPGVRRYRVRDPAYAGPISTERRVDGRARRQVFGKNVLCGAGDSSGSSSWILGGVVNHPYSPLVYAFRFTVTESHERI